MNHFLLIKGAPRDRFETREARQRARRHPLGTGCEEGAPAASHSQRVCEERVGAKRGNSISFAHAPTLLVSKLKAGPAISRTGALFMRARISAPPLHQSRARGGNFANLQTIPPYQHRMQSNYMLREPLTAAKLCFCKSVAFSKLIFISK